MVVIAMAQSRSGGILSKSRDSLCCEKQVSRVGFEFNSSNAGTSEARLSRRWIDRLVMLRIF